MEIIDKMPPDSIQKFKLHNVTLKMQNCNLVSGMIFIGSYG